MASIRLSAELERKLKGIAKREKSTQSAIIKKALNNYLETYYHSVSPYEAGKAFFGKYGSGRSDGSATYKRKIKEKISAKFSD
jgi:hypothetical protein